MCQNHRLPRAVGAAAAGRGCWRGRGEEIVLNLQLGNPGLRAVMQSEGDRTGATAVQHVHFPPLCITAFL